MRGGTEPPPPVFSDVTETAGVARIAQTYDAALADFDGDAHVDVLVPSHGATAVLLRNLGDGRFTEVIGATGIDPNGDKHGVGWGDYDNDGRPDLYVSLGAGRGTITKKNRLYHNEGGGRFRDVATEAGVTDPSGRSRSVAWLDANLDGRLDLLLANYASPNRLYLGRADGTFEEAPEAPGVTEPWATHLAWSDVDGDGAPDLLFAGTPGGLRLLRNDGRGHFTDVTRPAGLAGLGRSVSSIAFGDVDGDGDLDLYLGYGSDFSDVVLDRSAGTLTYAFFAGAEATGFDFETAADTASGVEADVWENGSPMNPARIQCGAATSPAAPRFLCTAAEAASPATPVGNGLLLWRDPEPTTRGAPDGSGPTADGTASVADSRILLWHLRWREPGDHHLTGIIRGGARPVAVGFARTAERGGSLWFGDGRGHFERAHEPSLHHHANCQLVQFADVNDDGWLDLYVVDSGVDGAGGRNLLFLGTGGGRFVPAPPESGSAPDSGEGRGVGAHFFDLDGDGWLDLFLTNGWGAPPFDQGPYRLLHNRTSASAGLRDRAVASAGWIVITLEGRTSNRAGLGAWIEVEACGVRRVRYQNGLANGYSQSLVPAHFGLGSCREPATLQIRWPSGIVQRLNGVATGRILRVVEGADP